MFVGWSVFILVPCLETTADVLLLVLWKATLVSIRTAEGSLPFLVLKMNNEPIFFHLWEIPQGMGENVCELYKQTKTTGIFCWLVMGKNLSEK